MSVRPDVAGEYLRSLAGAGEPAWAIGQVEGRQPGGLVKIA
jgi:hypothetical protein